MARQAGSAQRDAGGLAGAARASSVLHFFARENSGQLRRKLWWLALWAAIGLLPALIGFVPADSVKEVLAVLIKGIPGFENWINTNPGAAAVTRWVAAPLFLATVIAMPTFAAADRRFWNRWLGSEPDFLLANPLAAISETHLIKGYDPSIFAGRKNELAELCTLVEPAEEPFAWQMVTGRTGIGKTRLCVRLVGDLALEASGHRFLRRFRVVREKVLKSPPKFSRAWDAGFVDPARCAALEGWHPRRPTLLVFDEASRTFGEGLFPMLAALAAKGTPRRPVRALLIDHMSLDVVVRQPGMAMPVVGRRDPLALSGLSDAEMDELARHFPRHALSRSVLRKAAGGSPRSALYMLHEGREWNYRLAIRQWANAIIPGLAPASDTIDPTPQIEPEVAEALVAAALIGPVAIAATTVGDAFALAGKARRYFPDSDPALWKTTIPAFAPRDLGYEIAFRLFEQMSVQRQAAVTAVLLGNPRRLRESLHEFWFERSAHYSTEPDERLFGAAIAIQRRLDEAEPEVVAKIHQNLTGHFEALTASRDRTATRAHLQTARTYLRYRPFDPVVLNLCLKCEVNASLLDGRTGTVDREAIDHLTNPLITRWIADPEFARLYLNFLLNLTMGKRWGADGALLDRALAIVMPLVEGYRGGDDLHAEQAVGVGANLVTRLAFTGRCEEAKALVRAVRHAAGRAGASASRRFELNYAMVLLNFVATGTLPRMASAALDAAQALFDLASAPHLAGDAAMQLQLVGGLIHALDVADRSAPDAERRKWKNRLERAIAPVGADSSPDLRILACHALANFIHTNAFRNRFEPAEADYARLSELCHDEAGVLRWDCQGIYRKATGCLGGHYADAGRTDRSEPLMAAQLDWAETCPAPTPAMLERTVLGGFSDFARSIEAWQGLNHNSHKNGKRERFNRSVAAWHRYFPQIVKTARTVGLERQVLHAILGLLRCVKDHEATDSAHYAAIREQAQMLLQMAPHDPGVADLVSKLGAAPGAPPVSPVVVPRSA